MAPGAHDEAMQDTECTTVYGETGYQALKKLGQEQWTISVVQMIEFDSQ